MSELLELITDYIWTLDATYRFTAIDNLGETTHQYFNAEKCLGKNLWEIGFDANISGEWQRQRELVEAHEPFKDLILGWRCDDHSEHYISLTAVPEFDGKFQFMGYRGIARDITSQHREHMSLLRFREAMDKSGDAIYLTDCTTMKFLDVNTTASEKMGYTRTELLTMGPADLWLADSATVEKNLRAVIDAGKEGTRSESRAVSKTGQQSVAEVHRRAVQMGDRWVVVSIARDVTMRKRAEQAALRLGRMYAALSATEEAILRTRSPNELFQRVCEAAVDGGKFLTTAVLMLRPGSQELHVAAGCGHGLETLRTTDISVDATQPSGRGLVGTACRTGKSRISNDYSADASTAPWHALAKQIGIASATAVPVRRDAKTIGTILFYSDEKYAFDEEIVTLLERMAESMVYALDMFELEAEQVQSRDRIQYLATHDVLTDLPNRAMFQELLRQTIENGKRYDRKFAVMFIDIDRFKFINDSLGHEAGDTLLQEMAMRFKNCLRGSDVVARLGGDEFVVLVNEVSTQRQVASTAKKLLAAAIKSFRILGQEFKVTASIGVAFFPRDASDEQTLMKNADMAMYQAKEEGKNNFQFYSGDVRTHSMERMTLETQLRSAIENNELSLHYQPKMDSFSGRINGVEALIRWQSKELGYVSPMQLIPIAEETGLIIPIGRWVLQTACEQNVAWRREGLPPICVSVNLSARQFEDRDLLTDIAETLRSTGMAPELLELELTESMVMRDVERAVTLLKAIKEMGVRLAIDDFGTGYCSLAQIKRFPIDTLKVDRSFTREISLESGETAIIAAVIAMGKTLSLTVVAEGVETSEQEQYLRDHNCDEMQGYHFSKPITAAELAILLRSNDSRVNPRSGG